MKLATADLEVDVRPGTADDVPLLMSFIKSLAKFEKLEVRTTEAMLKEALFDDSPAAQTLLAFVDGKPAAYVVYFFTFATMVGKRGLWVDDLFVSPEFRGRGIGMALMAYMANVATRHKCGRFEWIVLDWNRSAKKLFQGLGATVLGDWEICRLDEEALEKLAGELVIVDS